LVNFLLLRVVRCLTANEKVLAMAGLNMNISSNLNSSSRCFFYETKLLKIVEIEKHEAGKNGRIENSDIQTRYCQYSVVCCTLYQKHFKSI